MQPAPGPPARRPGPGRGPGGDGIEPGSTSTGSSADAAAADLRRPSEGTRWTNRQLLFHMLFGYLIVRALLVLARVFSLLPDGASTAFAKLLDSAHRPFDLINYLGSCAGARIIPPSRMTPDARPRHRSPPAGTCNTKPGPPCAAACTTPPPGTRSSPAT